jgi:hypothetical protein
MEPRRLSSRQGWEWIKQGYALFIKAPLIWLVLLAIWFVAAVAISSVPVVGEPLVSLLGPVIWAGLMVGCRALSQGEDLELSHLVIGFKKHTSQLVTLGGITLVAQFAILGLMMLAGGAALVSLMVSGQAEMDPNVIFQAMAGASFAIVIGSILFFLLMMAMWFAPMLVYFRNVPPVQAIKLSLQAFLNNVGAMVVFDLTFLALAVLATLPMGLGWLILFPVVYTSSYASYIDIFPAVNETGSTPPASDANMQNDQSYF